MYKVKGDSCSYWTSSLIYFSRQRLRYRHVDKKGSKSLAGEANGSRAGGSDGTGQEQHI